MTLPSLCRGLEAKCGTLTDVESWLWLNPACIKPSILDYPSQPMVTSATAQKWIVCFVCVYASVCRSCGSLDKKQKSHLHLPANLKKKNVFTDRKRSKVVDLRVSSLRENKDTYFYKHLGNHFFPHKF